MFHVITNKFVHVHVYYRDITTYSTVHAYVHNYTSTSIIYIYLQDVTFTVFIVYGSLGNREIEIVCKLFEYSSCKYIPTSCKYNITQQEDYMYNSKLSILFTNTPSHPRRLTVIDISLRYSIRCIL